jgi:mRNA interferase RelE/StbE
MKNYRILVRPEVYKDLMRLPKNMQFRILDKIESLSSNPRPQGVKKLKKFTIPNNPFDDYYRIRIGDYRVIYTIEDDVLTITVVKVGSRKDIYHN